MKNKINDNVFIIILLFLVTTATICILLYDYFPLDENRLKPLKYTADENTKKIMEEIKERSTYVYSDSEKKILKTYTVDTTDLIDEKETGKQNPFAEVSEPVLKEVK